MKKKVTCRGGGWEGGRYLSKIENGVSACLSDGKIEDLHMLCLLCFTKERTNERTVKHKMAATGKENEALPRRVESSFKVSDTHPSWGQYYEPYWIRNCRLAACFYLSEAVQCWLHWFQLKMKKLISIGLGMFLGRRPLGISWRC